MFYNLILPSPCEGHIVKPEVSELLSIVYTPSSSSLLYSPVTFISNTLWRYSSPFPSLPNLQYINSIKADKPEDLLTYLVFNLQHYILIKRKFDPFKPLQSLFLTIQYHIYKSAMRIDSNLLSDPFCKLIFDLFICNTNTSYFNLLVKFQMSVLFWLLDNGCCCNETAIRNKEEESCCNVIHNFLCYLVETNVIQQKCFTINQLNTILNESLFHISQLCYLLWECISNTSNMFDFKELTPTGLFKFFYLDILLYPSTVDITSYLMKSYDFYDCSVLRIPLQNIILDLPFHRNQLIKQYSKQV